jgi:hypothetical protein
MSPQYKHPVAQTRELSSSVNFPRMNGTLEETSLVHRACQAHLRACRLPVTLTIMSLSISPSCFKAEEFLTVNMTRKLPHTSPATLALAPLQTAMTAAKSFICESIGSSRVKEVVNLLPQGAGGCRARVWDSSSSTLTTWSSMN